MSEERKEEVKAKAVKADKEEVEAIKKAKIEQAIKKAKSIKNEMQNKQLAESEIKILDEQYEQEQQVVTSKQEFIHLQNQYRSTFLNLMALKYQVEFILKQIETGNISMKYEGAIMSENLIKINHDIKLHNYKMLLSSFNQQKDRLIYCGVKPEDLTKVELGELIIKEVPKIKGKDLVKGKVKDETQSYIN